MRISGTFLQCRECSKSSLLAAWQVWCCQRGWKYPQTDPAVHVPMYLHNFFFSLRFESPKSHTCVSHHLGPEPSSPSEVLWLHSLGFTRVGSSCLAALFTPGESECQLQNASTWHQFPVKNFCCMVLASSELTPEKVLAMTTNWRKSYAMYYFSPAKHLVQNHISLSANSLM